MSPGPLPTSKLSTVNLSIAQKMFTGHSSIEDKLSHIDSLKSLILSTIELILLLVLYVLIGNIQKICTNDKYTLLGKCTVV